ncbi:MAG: ABC-2 transporter permease [Clostridia bacterium]|nr:ABC-2 transporter permease [Clostridia bacterium]
MSNTAKLVSKELKLSASPLSYVFILGAAFCMIPNYPALVGAFFVCLGIFYSFQNAREANDTLYTVLLPVAKRDAVKAKYLFAAVVEALAFAGFAALTALRTALSEVPPYDKNALMQPNLALLGYVLIVFTIFNTVFICGFYKTAYKIGKPFIVFSVLAFVFIVATEVVHHLPGLGALNKTGADGFYVRLAILVASAAIYAASFFTSMNAAEKRFEKIDF